MIWIIAAALVVIAWELGSIASSLRSATKVMDDAILESIQVELANLNQGVDDLTGAVNQMGSNLAFTIHQANGLAEESERFIHSS